MYTWSVSFRCRSPTQFLLVLARCGTHMLMVCRRAERRASSRQSMPVQTMMPVVTHSYSWLDPGQPRLGRAQHLSINVTSPDWRLTTSVASAAVHQLLVSDNADGDGDELRQCSGHWRPPQQALFHVAHVLILISFVVPSTRATLGLIHLVLVAGTM